MVWQPYIRSLEMTASGRNPVAPKAPASVINRIVGEHEKRYFFDIWMHCGKSWPKVQIFERAVWTQRNKSLQNWRWLTEGQVREHYAGNDEITQAIIEVKMECEETWRPHPEVPYLLAARQ